MKRTQTTMVHAQQHNVVRRVVPTRENSQMNAVNKINSLPSVSVSTQPRMVRQSVYSTIQSNARCFICDESILGQATSLTDSETITSREKVTKKLAKMVGDDFCVIVSEDDVICRRCLTLFNTMDKYESDLENVRTRLRGFINKKYSIEDDDQPPSKIQKLNSGSPAYARFQNNSEESSPTVVRKIVGREAAENQLKNLSNSSNTPNSNKKGPIKLYKCIACEFKTTDLQAFQPHSSVCKGQVNKNQTSPASQGRVVRQTYGSNTVRQVIKPSIADKSPQKVGGTTIIRNSVQPSQQIQQCRTCSFKTADRNLFNEHQRVHMKQRPFKCRMCLERFETREAAQVHAKTHQNPANGWKCGICSRTFIKREMFDAHMKTHEKFKSVTQEEVIHLNKKNPGQIQKPLTDIIKEALSEDDQDAVNELIEFHSCNLCSLTFVNKKLYAQHMRTHESPDKAETKSALNKGKQQDTLGDLESIFEKMHSESAHHTAANGATSDKNVLITTQEGGITYNITIPQDDAPQEDGDEKHNVRIDMPALGGDVVETEDVHVSMPSLHGEDENTQSSQEHSEVQQMESGEVPMDLEEMQNAAGDGQQLKFIVDENGQFLQLDNHILTTDAEGNQILVQGTDQEQLQHLLQSVGVDGNQVLVQLQGNGEEEGEGTMMLGDGSQGQMILVQGADGESQLIDASMLQTEGGNLILQQGADGETHLTTADGVPVSVSFSGEGGDGHITVTMASGHEEGQQIFLQQPLEDSATEGQEGEVHEQTAESASELSQSQESSQDAGDEAPASQESQPETEAPPAADESISSTTDADVEAKPETTEATEESSELKTEEQPPAEETA